jgi:hypothetical protein
MSDNFIEDMEEISREIAEHQIKTFGRVLTREEAAQSEIERYEESKRKYAGMTVEEVVRLQDEELARWEKEMIERYGPEFFENFNYIDEANEKKEVQKAINA